MCVLFILIKNQFSRGSQIGINRINHITITLKIMAFEELIVYKESFALAMDIFQLSKNFPKEERYNLTDQIRRSSRAICSCISEGYRKRQYKAYFISKLSDADMENSETQVWLQFCHACNYINDEKYSELRGKSQKIGRRINFMLKNPEKFL